MPSTTGFVEQADGLWQCAYCKAEWVVDKGEWDYCPGCGASIATWVGVDEDV